MAKPAAPQLSLFSGAGPDPSGPAAVVTPAQRALAARLPASLYLGTSSWTFPGWAGLVYAGHPSKEKLVSQGLLAYARHPLLRTVCFDRSYYAPPTIEEWRAYAQQLPPHFVTVAKAYSEITTLVFADHPRLGDRAGQRNPRFLDPELTLREVVRPYLDGLGALAGPLVFELPPVPERLLPAEPVFLAQLERLLESLPRAGSFAIELRNRRLLTKRYLHLVGRYGVGHVFNYWGAMPSLREQAALCEQAQLDPESLPGDLVLRLMLPPGASYEGLKAAYAPFDRLVEPQPEMRRDALELMRRGLAAGRRVFVIANNKAEGSAPRTLFALAEAIAA